MFTGLIEETGRIAEVRRQAQGARLVVEAERVLDGAGVGDSIAVSGVCLTAVQITGRRVAFDAVAETLRRSTLGELAPGDLVNLERALALGDRLGGHLVQGHVDGVGILTRAREEGISRVFTISAPPEVLADLVEKGSVAVDGVSLTVAALADDSFDIALIPETLRATTLGRKRVGDRFNLESDLIGKYVRRFLESRGPARKLSPEFLAEHGFA